MAAELSSTPPWIPRWNGLASSTMTKNGAAQSKQSITRPPTIPVEEFLKNSAADLNHGFSAKCKFWNHAPPRFSNKPAGKLVASMETVGASGIAGIVARKPAETVVGKARPAQATVGRSGSPPMNIFVLTLYGRRSRPKLDLIRSFDAMAASFDVFDRTQIEDCRKAAIKAGREWFADRSAEELRPPPDRRTSTFSALKCRATMSKFTSALTRRKKILASVSRASPSSPIAAPSSITAASR